LRHARPCAFPLLQTTEPDERYMRDIVLPSFRATAASWAAAKYPARETELAGRAATAAFVAVGPNDVTALAANAGAQAVRAAANDRRVSMPPPALLPTLRKPPPAPPDSGTGHSDGFNLKFAEASGADAVTAAFWSAVSIDATQVEEGRTASDIAGSPLWPQGQPDLLQSLWQEMKAALLADGRDWQEWTIWYDDRLAGRVRDEERELVYVRIEEALWSQGPAIVNAEIKRRIEELVPPPRVVEVSASGMAGGTGRASLSVAEPAISAIPLDNPPITGAAAQHLSEISAAWQSADAASAAPYLRRQYVPDVVVNPVALGAGGTPPAPIEAIPEQEPLATRFCVNSEGLIDVVPDPPAPGTAADPLQREFYEETRLKAQALVALGHNLLGDLSGPANRFCDGLKDRIEDISITSLWSRGNTLRIRLNAHDLSTSNKEPDPGAYKL
jgi:hypothetical protein